MIRTTVIGSYPKVTEKNTDNLPGVIDKWQRKVLRDEDMEQELQKVTRRVIKEQEEAGLSLVTDGQIRWEDLAHPIVRGVSGLRRGTLRRFFDNNTYYRRLEVDGPVRWQKSAVADEYRFASKASARPVKVVLPGPLTLVTATELKKGQTREGMLDMYSEILYKEVEALSKAGVRDIQLDEPALEPGEPLIDRTIEHINGILKGITARRWVAVYFNDVSPILQKLAKLQIEVLSIDLVSSPDSLKQLRSGVWGRELALGLVDARNTKLELADDLRRTIAKLTEAVPLDTLWLTPNAGLEFLPHENAKRKLQLMREVAERL